MTDAVPGAVRAETIGALRAALLHGSRVAHPALRLRLHVAAWWAGQAPAPFDVDLPVGVDLLVLNGAPLELAGRIAQRRADFVAAVANWTTH